VSDHERGLGQRASIAAGASSGAGRPPPDRTAGAASELSL
jgi:hypothetical protein